MEYDTAVDDLFGNPNEQEQDRFSLPGQNAAMQGVSDVDEDPETAARSLTLSKATGVPAPVIHGDVEGFEREHKTRLVGDMIRGNPAIQDYINNYPMASKVSNDDYPALDAVHRSVNRAVQSGMDVGIKTFQDSIEEEPLGVPDGTAEKFATYLGIPSLYTKAAGASPVGQFMRTNLWTTDTIMRLFSAGTKTAARVAGSIATDTLGEEKGAQIEREVGGMLEWALQRGDIKLGGELPPEVQRQARRTVEAAAPYVEAGEIPPPGVNNMIDKLHVEQAKEDSKNLRDALKDVQATKTRERSPEAMEAFLERGTEGRTIGLSSDAVRELYGDKLPVPDDGVLGWIPGIEDQLRRTALTGGDIEVPLSTWLARVEPEVAKQLEDHVRVRKEGFTKFETEEVEATKKPLESSDPMPGEPFERREPVGLDETVRREAQFEPLAQVGRRDVRLERASSEIDKFGQTFDTFKITEEGKSVGTVTINETPKGVLYIENIAAEGPNAIGVHAVRSIMEELRREYPNATKVGGYRVSGAREKAAKESWVEAKLDGSQKGLEELAQVLAEIEPRVPKGWERAESMPREPAPPGTVVDKVGGATIEYRPEELLTVREAEVVEAMHKVLNQIAPNLPLVYADRIEVQGAGMKSPGQVHGLYKPTASSDVLPYIIVSLNNPNAMGTLLHETIHHLRSGYFTTKEWGILEDAARNGDWVKKHNIESRYETAPEWHRLEESIAEEYAAWSKESGLLKSSVPSEVVEVFKKLKEFFETIREKIREIFGKEVTADELFARVSAGEIGERQPSMSAGGRFNSFKQMLAQATEVEEKSLFEKAAAIGMTQDQFKRYMKKIDEQRAETQAKAEARAAKAADVTRTEQWKEAEPRVRRESAEHVNQRPDILADEYFRRGMIDGERVKKQKFDEKFLTPEQKAGLEPALYGPKGVHPDSVAGLFGFVSGGDMIAALTNVEANRQAAKMTPAAYKQKLINEKTQATMMRRYGVPEHDALLKEAREDILTDTQMDLLHEHTLALAMRSGQAPIEKAAFKEAIKQEFEKTPVAQAKNMEKFLREAGRSGRAMEQAFLKGDFTEAFRQSQHQYALGLLATEAKRFTKEVDRNKKLLDRFASRSVSGMPQDYTDQIHGIMRQIQSQVKRSVQDLQSALEGTTLEGFVAAKEADLREVPVAEFLYDGTFNKPIDAMTVEEFRAVDGSLKTLAHNGRQDLRVEKAGEKADLEAIKEEMIAQLETFKPAKMVPLDKGKGGILNLPTGGIRRVARTLVAAHLQAENLMNRWDRWDPKGVFNQYIMRPLAEGSNHLAGLERKYSQQLMKLRDNVDLREIVDNPVLRDPLTGEFFVMSRRNFRAVMANVGNASNLDKLAKGYKVTPEILMEWVHRVATKEDWDFAQGQGRIFSEINKESARMYERLSGVAPEKIDIVPIQTPFGEYEGWYHPLIYDRLREGGSKTLMGKTGLEEAEYFRATTSAGYTKKRSGYSAPLSLSLDESATRMKQMLNDIAMREPVINAGKFFYDKDLRAAVTKHSALGPEVKDALIPYLKDVANASNIDSAAHSIAAQWSEWFRQNVISTLIGLNPGTVMKHGTTAAVQSLQEVGPLNFLRETKNLFNRLPSGESNWGFAMKTSEELQRRHRHYAETLGGGYQEAFQEPSLRAFIQHAGSYPVAMSDLLSATPTWLAAYRKAMDEGATHGDGIYAGDRAVRRAHGSTAQTNRPAVMRGGAVSQWFTSLFGFFSHIMNRQVELVWKAADTIEKIKEKDVSGAAKGLPEIGGLIARDSGKILIPGLFAYILWPALIEELVTPLPHDEKEGWAKWAGKALVKNLSASWIGIRDITAAAMTGHDPSAGLVGTLFKAGTDVARDVVNMATKGGHRAGLLIKHGAVALGALTGLSNAQIGKTGEFTYNYIKGKEKPRKLGGPFMTTPDSLLRGIRYGESKAPRR